MSNKAKGRVIIRSEQMNNSLECMLNSLLMSDFNYPVCNIENLKTN